MPMTVQMSTLETPPSGNAGEEIVDHPLSPTQEQVTEAIVSISNWIIYYYLISMDECIYNDFSLFSSTPNFHRAAIAYHRKSSIQMCGKMKLTSMHRMARG